MAHLQMLVDVVVSDDDPFLTLVKIIELLNSELARHGLQETVWVARLPEDR